MGERRTLPAVDTSTEYHLKTRHWFSEANQPGYYDPAAADLAWQRPIDFLRQHLA